MATRKTIVEATSQIIGQKEVNHMTTDDRGPLDLTRRIDELEAEVSALKKKQEELDNRVSKWYNYTMKNIMIAFLVLCFTATVGNTNETKTYTPKETLEAFSKVPGKIANHISNEKQEIIDYQKKSWADAKEQTAKNIATIKSWFVKN
mgnify:FL=1